MTSHTLCELAREHICIWIQILKWVKLAGECFEMAESSVETSDPLKKKVWLSLSLKVKKEGPRIAAGERFELIDVAEVESVKQPIIPANTQKATKLAVGAFEDWVSQRNKRSEEQCSSDVLMTDDGKLLCKWLCVSGYV